MWLRISQVEKDFLVGSPPLGSQLANFISLAFPRALYTAAVIAKLLSNLAQCAATLKDILLCVLICLLLGMLFLKNCSLRVRVLHRGRWGGNWAGWRSQSAP